MKKKKSKKKLERGKVEYALRISYHDDEGTTAVAVTDVEEALKCELLISDSANSLKSCLEHERPGYQQNN